MEGVTGVIRLAENVIVDNLLVTAAIITALVTVGTLLWKVFRPLKNRVEEFLDWHEHFLSQWEGYHADKPGEVDTPGVMERLSRIDGEFKRNGGSSMKDSVEHLTKEVNDLALVVKKLRDDMGTLSDTIRKLHRDMGENTP